MVRITQRWEMDAWRLGLCVFCLVASLYFVATSETVRGWGLFVANVVQFLFFLERERDEDELNGTSTI